MEKVIFTTDEEFRAWLEGRPREWAGVLALRSALRVAPIALVKQPDADQTLHLRLTNSLRRSLSISWSAANTPLRAAAANNSLYVAASAATSISTIAIAAARAAADNAATATAIAID